MSQVLEDLEREQEQLEQAATCASQFRNAIQLAHSSKLKLQMKENQIFLTLPHGRTMIIDAVGSISMRQIQEG